jgi:hypothetical protein
MSRVSPALRLLLAAVAVCSAVVAGPAAAGPARVVAPHPGVGALAPSVAQQSSAELLLRAGRWAGTAKPTRLGPSALSPGQAPALGVAEIERDDTAVDDLRIAGGPTPWAARAPPVVG